jgi:hypothetical protein
MKAPGILYFADAKWSFMNSMNSMRGLPRSITVGQTMNTTGASCCVVTVPTQYSYCGRGKARQSVEQIGVWQ